MHKDLSEGQKQKINLFIEEALTFNKKHNIFVRKSLDEIIEKDVLDCIPLTKKIDKHSSVLDLGSGGGFPGIIASIIKPEAHIDLLEKSQKKCYFLNKTIDLLGLKNTKVLNTVISKNNNLGSYTLITARAFSSTTNILELTKNNLDDDGKYVLLKGKKEKITEELATIDTNKYKYEIIKLENKTYERHLLEIKKSE
jgi:16S rRNA (guanine527-N7)-methyltransferase